MDAAASAMASRAGVPRPCFPLGSPAGNNAIRAAVGADGYGIPRVALVTAST
jgi:hypothetical protein